MESGTIKKQGTASEMTSTLKELNTSLHRPKRLFKNETVCAVGTSRERHKLVRLLSRQTLYRTVSSQVIYLFFCFYTKFFQHYCMQIYPNVDYLV